MDNDEPSGMVATLDEDDGAMTVEQDGGACLFQFEKKLALCGKAKDGGIADARRCSKFAPVRRESGILATPECVEYEDDGEGYYRRERYTYEVAGNVAANVAETATAQSFWMRLRFVMER